jgi:hypothetical protein
MGGYSLGHAIENTGLHVKRKVIIDLFNIVTI